MREIVQEQARKINEELRVRGLSMATAESCTGGLIASAITSVPGSSEVFKGGVVAYSNDVKNRVLGVSNELLEEHGAVSEAVVVEMVRGVCNLMRCDCGVSTSGVAGPGGGTKEKPVGMVWVAVSVCGNVKTSLLQLEDRGRLENICVSSEKVLSLLLKQLQECSVVK